jgi:hypothetical protein
MTLFEPDLLKPPGRLRLQYDTWEVVSRGVLQNVSSRLSWRKPFQVEFRKAREVRRVKASAWNFELFPNPVFVMRIISRIHVDDLRDLVRKDSGDDQTLNLSLKG